MIPEGEPLLETDRDVLDVMTELAGYEPIFHRPEKGTTRAEFERITADDFWEIGASGRRYSRAHVLDVLEARYQSPQNEELEASGFYCRKLAADMYLLSYDLVQEKVRRTRRTTISQRTADGWKIVFHQGTIVQD